MQAVLDFIRTPTFGNVLLYSQIVVSTLLVVVILIQGKGAEVSGIFGGTSGVYRTKRGIEKWLHIFTIILVILFLGLGIVNLIAIK